MPSSKRQSAALAEPPGLLRRRIPLIAAMLIAGAAALAFGWKTLDAGFIMGDDQRFVTDHFLVNHPSLENAWTLLTIPHGDLYQPLPMLSFQVDYALASETPSGVFPFAFHLTNVLLHAANAMLVVLLVSVLARRIIVGALTGLLFATHPMAMETVAWVSGRMILLATLFSLIVLILAVRRPRRPGRVWPIAIWLAWIASLASKVMPTIPIVAWLFDRSVHRQTDRRGLWTYAALMIIGGGAVVAMSVLTQAEGFGAAANPANMSNAARTIILASGQYLEQYVAPTQLSPWTPPLKDVAWSDSRLYLAGAEIAVLLVLVAVFRKRAPIVAAGLVAFGLLLGPFLFASLARRLFVADRYMYLPMIGLHMAVVASVVGLVGRIVGRKAADDGPCRRAQTWAILPIGALAIWWLLVGLDLATAWRNTLSYAHRIVACFPDDPDARNELARAQLFSNQPADAVATAQSGLARWPENPRLAAQLGEALSKLGDNASALAAFDQALRGAPEHTRTRYLRAITLQALGRSAEARDALQSLIDDQPEFLPAYSALAREYRERGDAVHLRETLKKALAINPYHRDNLFDLAMLDYAEGRLNDAETLLRQLTERQPNDAPGLLNLGAVLARMGRDIEAVKVYDRLLASHPAEILARFNRGDLLTALGHTADAEQDFRVILKSHPSNLDAATRLHQLLANDRRWPALIAMWSEFRADSPSDANEAECYSAWAQTLRALDRHEPLPAAASGLQGQDGCAGWIGIYARLRQRDWATLGNALDRIPQEAANPEQVDRQRRVILSAFQSLPMEIRNDRPGLYVAARLMHYLGDTPSAMKFLDIVRNGDDIWAEKAKAMLEKQSGEDPPK